MGWRWVRQSVASLTQNAAMLVHTLKAYLGTLPPGTKPPPPGGEPGSLGIASKNIPRPRVACVCSWCPGAGGRQVWRAKNSWGSCKKQRPTGPNLSASSSGLTRSTKSAPFCSAALAATTRHAQAGHNWGLVCRALTVQPGQALAIYVHMLRDEPAAENYCLRHYNSGHEGARDLYITLLQLYLKPDKTGATQVDAALRVLRKYFDVRPSGFSAFAAGPCPPPPLLLLFLRGGPPSLLAPGFAESRHGQSAGAPAGRHQGLYSGRRGVN